jgi:hypothetical protein
MKLKILLFTALAILLSPSSALAQYTIQWEKSLGGTDYEIATSMQQTIDGGYIVAGHSSSNDGDVSGNHGLADYWVVKLTNTGAIEWQNH